MELGLDVALADLLVQAKITEVLSGLGDNIVVELEFDTAPVVLCGRQCLSAVILIEMGRWMDAPR